MVTWWFQFSLYNFLLLLSIDDLSSPFRFYLLQKWSINTRSLYLLQTITMYNSKYAAYNNILSYTISILVRNFVYMIKHKISYLYLQFILFPIGFASFYYGFAFVIVKVILSYIKSEWAIGTVTTKNRRKKNSIFDELWNAKVQYQ